MTKVVGIVAKPTQPKAIELAEEVARWLSKKGHQLFLDSNSLAEEAWASSLGKLISRQEMPSKASVIVVLGGDGTFISVARHPSQDEELAVSGGPIIVGVNMGSLGFLTEVLKQDIKDVISSSLKGEGRLSTRQLLSVEVLRESKVASVYHAMNDLVLTKEALARIFGLEVVVNNSKAALLRGDGVIIASPSGSTAYSLAAGGSIVHPDVEALLLTPICSHSLTSRPVVLPSKSQIELKVADGLTEKEFVHLTVDGQEGERIYPGDVVKVTTSSYKYRIASSEGKDYFSILGEKLGWAKVNSGIEGG